MFDYVREKRKVVSKINNVCDEINNKRDYYDCMFEEDVKEERIKLNELRDEEEKLNEKRDESIGEWGDEIEGKLIRVRTSSIGYFNVGRKNSRGRIGKGEVVVCMGSRKENKRRLLCMYNGGLVSISKKQVIRECDVIEECDII
jgi:hypothetical protein